DKACLLQAFAERRHQVPGVGKGLAAEETDHRHRRLLRARAERPTGRRAGEERDERAALQASWPGRTAACNAAVLIRDRPMLGVLNGPGSAAHHFVLRCARDTSHCAAAPHSITSSARKSSEVGSSMPIALAVLRLTMSSNLFGCSTGSSAGVAPLRILATNSASRRKSDSTSTP